MSLTRGLLLVVALAAQGCDRFDAAPAPAGTAPPGPPQALARPEAEAVMKAAATCVERCQISVVPLGSNEGGGRALTDSCAASPGSAKALQAALDGLQRAVEQAPRGSAGLTGFGALGRAMAASLETAALSPEPPSGLSMQYGLLARAFRALYADATVPLDPPSLVASLGEVPGDAACELPEPQSGYRCKTGAGANICWYGAQGAHRPATCYLRGARPPSPLVWKITGQHRAILELPAQDGGK
jgi:hypothetical protein